MNNIPEMPLIHPILAFQHHSIDGDDSRYISIPSMQLGITKNQGVHHHSLAEGMELFNICL